MGVFNSAVLTTRGNELLVDAVAGDKIVFTRMAVGSGVYSDEERERRALEKAVGLKDVRQEFSFSAHRKVSEQCVLLTAVISNRELERSYKITEIGIYGKRLGDEEDFLCSVAVTKSLEESDTFPPFNGLQECQIVQDYYITISPDAEVSVNTEGACVLREEFENFKNVIIGILDGKVDKTAVANNLLTTAEGYVLDARQGPVLKNMIDDVNIVINNLKQSFQAGCKKIVDKLTALGYAPTAPQGPDEINVQIQVIFDDRFNIGREQGRQDVIADPGAYGIDTGIKYSSSVATSSVDLFSLGVHRNEVFSDLEDVDQTVDRIIELKAGSKILYGIDMTQKVSVSASYEGRINGGSEWVLKTAEGEVIQSGSTGGLVNGFDDYGNASGGPDFTDHINIDLFETPFTTSYSYVVLSMRTHLRASCGVTGSADGEVTYNPIVAKYK